MNKFSAEPKPPKTRQLMTLLAAIAALGLAGLVPMPVWAQGVLTVIGLGALALLAVIGVIHDKAHKKGPSSQPGAADGSPNLPHIPQLIAFSIGICSIAALCYLGLPLKEGGFTSADWWLVLLSISALGGFGYASRIQKRHNKAYMAWRDTQQPQ